MLFLGRVSNSKKQFQLKKYSLQRKIYFHYEILQQSLNFCTLKFHKYIKIRPTFTVKNRESSRRKTRDFINRSGDPFKGVNSLDYFTRHEGCRRLASRNDKKVKIIRPARIEGETGGTKSGKECSATEPRKSARKVNG